MDYARALARAAAEYPPSWDFSGCTCLTLEACTPEQRSATHEYGVELRRRAWAIVSAKQHRYITDVNVAQVEATADRRGAPAQESTPPSSRTSLFECASRDKSAVLSEREPDVNVAQVEATADRRGAPAQESSAPPSSRASLFERASSDKSAVLSEKQQQTVVAEEGESWGWGRNRTVNA